MACEWEASASLYIFVIICQVLLDTSAASALCGAGLMLTQLSQNALQMNIKRAMKLLSSCFHFQGTWPKPSGFLWRTYLPLPPAPATQSGHRPEAKPLPCSPCQRNPASLLPRLKAEICASRAVARAPQENFSYIQINNWTQASQPKTRLTVGTTGCWQRDWLLREASTAKLNNRRLVPSPPPPPPPCERQPFHCSPWGQDWGILVIGPR